MTYNHFDIPIFQKTYDFYKLIHEYSANIPKMERYTIWQKIKTVCIEIIEGLLTVNHLSGAEKLSLMNDISVKIDLLRVFVRLAYETKAISEKKYIALQENLDEIGRMLGGWIKNVKRK